MKSHKNVRAEAPVLSIVVPMYNEADNIYAFFSDDKSIVLERGMDDPTIEP